MPVHDRLRAAVDPSVSEGTASDVPIRLGDELVERDRVAEPAAARVRGRGQEADVRRMPAVHVRVRDAAEHGEVVAVLAQGLQVRRRARSRGRLPWGRKAPAAGRDYCRCRTSAAARRPARGERDAGAARAKGEIIDSRNGSDSATAEPRRKRRREMARRVEMSGEVMIGDESVGG